MKLTLKEIETAVGGRLNNTFFYDNIVNGVVIDSRCDVRGKLFVALKGEKIDGHSFINELFENGAVCCLSEDENILHKYPIIYVKDSKKSLLLLAEYYRNKLSSLKTIGITGSTGKTTTKDIVSYVLEERFIVQKTKGNYNNEIGMPLTIFGMDEATEIGIVEMGMRNFGEIRELSKASKPDVAIITNIGDAHIEILGSREGILQAKTELFENLSETGIGILNIDDDLLCGYKSDKKIITISIDKEANYTARNIKEHGLKGISFDLDSQKESIGNINFYVPSPGIHMVYNALAAIAVGRHFGMTYEEIRSGLSKFISSGNRMNIFTNNKDVIIINDTYNANPDSMRSAVDVLKKATGRKICVLGDMLELGEMKEKFHFEIGEYVKNAADLLFCFGELSKFICDGAVSGSTKVKYFKSKRELISELIYFLDEGDTVLIKASRGMKFEEIVDSIRELNLLQ